MKKRVTWFPPPCQFYTKSISILNQYIYSSSTKPNISWAEQNFDWLKLDRTQLSSVNVLQQIGPLYIQSIFKFCTILFHFYLIIHFSCHFHSTLLLGYKSHRKCTTFSSFYKCICSRICYPWALQFCNKIPIMLFSRFFDMDFFLELLLFIFTLLLDINFCFFQTYNCCHMHNAWERPNTENYYHSQNDAKMFP